MANTQKFVFGASLPRGHGHRGRISGLVCFLFRYVHSVDVLSLRRDYTSFTPKASSSCPYLSFFLIIIFSFQKRKPKSSDASFLTLLTYLHSLPPFQFQVSVIGESSLACVLSQRLLSCNYRVLVSSDLVYKSFFTSQGGLLHDRSPNLIPLLSDLCKASDVIIIAVPPYIFFFTHSSLHCLRTKLFIRTYRSSSMRSLR